MHIVILDAHTANPGDLSWQPFEALGSCAVYPRTPLDSTIERCQGAAAVITNKAVLNRHILGSLPELRYIGVLATGYNVVDVAAARDSGVVVTNVPGYSTPSVAQLVFALILEMTHHAGHHSETVRAGGWSACPDFSYWDFPLTELAGRTLGIIGFGEIGAAVGRIGAAFGMRVLASKRYWSTPAPDGVEPAENDTIFRESDIVSLHCPLTDSTKHLINRQTLGLMKPGAFLINTGRGPLIDEAALADALNSGRIGGAGLDVLSQEPPPPDNPLIVAKNCIITPHIGWASLEARQRLITAAAENLAAFVRGQPQNVVS